MQSLILVLASPLILLNLFGSVIGIIWLMILGEWGALGTALGAMFIAMFAIGFALMPALLVTTPAAVLFEKGGVRRIASYPLLFIGNLWMFFVMCTWAILWFGYYQKHADSSSIVPMLLIAYGVATGPWAYAAQRASQGDSIRSTFADFFLQIASAVMLVLLAFVGAHSKTALITFLAIMGVGLLLDFGVSVMLAIEESRYQKRLFQ